LCQYHAVFIDQVCDTHSIAPFAQYCPGSLWSFMLPNEFWVDFSISVMNVIVVLVEIELNM
jgi:hypothetical protein